MERALKLLRTDGFVLLETAIKRNALEQLGLDTRTDEVDLYFTPMESMDFYKCLDLVVKEGNFSMSATRMGEGMQNAIVIAVLRALEDTRRQGAIILLEEPEMFLTSHHAALPLPDASEDRRYQSGDLHHTLAQFRVRSGVSRHRARP